MGFGANGRMDQVKSLFTDRGQLFACRWNIAGTIPPGVKSGLSEPSGVSGESQFKDLVRGELPSGLRAIRV